MIEISYLTINSVTESIWQQSISLRSNSLHKQKGEEQASVGTLMRSLAAMSKTFIITSVFGKYSSIFFIAAFLTIVFLVVVLVIGCCLKLGDGAVSAWIVIRPPQGPFRLGQTVQFTCEVDSLPTENLTFQWRSVEYTSGGSSYSGQSFNKTFTNKFTLRYVWFFCSILRNTTLLTSSDKLVEIHGKLIKSKYGTQEIR